MVPFRVFEFIREPRAEEVNRGRLRWRCPQLTSIQQKSIKSSGIIIDHRTYLHLNKIVGILTLNLPKKIADSVSWDQVLRAMFYDCKFLHRFANHLPNLTTARSVSGKLSVPHCWKPPVSSDDRYRLAFHLDSAAELCHLRPCYFHLRKKPTTATA
jgi:hypothetical protein